jgi:ribonuclease-3
MLYKDFVKQGWPNIQNNIKYNFEHEGLISQAFTHKSMGIPNQEILEFRGDSILDFVLTEWMLGTFPNQTEGFFGKLWDRMARYTNFAAIAKKLGFEEYILKADHVKITDQILADTLEAVVGAIYLDGGLSAAKQFILQHCTAIPEDTDYKTQLQERTQKFGYTPIYETIQNSGENNRLIFTAKLKIPSGYPLHIRGPHTYLGEGFTKKEAEQNAAKAALEEL